jgi:very-short-patch-repair endonuclease
MGVREIVQRARALRKTPTDAERTMWQALRGKQIEGFRFRRQRPIGKYIVDFVCLDAKLVVELDGGQHAEQLQYDKRRTVALKKEGFRVLRFWNNEVFENLAGVLEMVRAELLRDGSHNPIPAFTLPREGVHMRALSPKSAFHGAESSVEASPFNTATKDPFPCKGGEARVSQRMRCACRTAFRCSETCALQGDWDGVGSAATTPKRTQE